MQPATGRLRFFDTGRSARSIRRQRPMNITRKGQIAGAGIGLRPQHYADILDGTHQIPWFEALAENYFGAGGLPLHFLERVRERFPLTLHGVGMSLGSADPLNFSYLDKLKGLAGRIQPAWISDHLAWISAGGHYVHDLLPLPYTQEALEHIASRIVQVQEYLGCQMLIENPSTYMSFSSSEMSESVFLAELATRTDCLLLLDVNNLYVSATNHGFDAEDYLGALPPDRVKEIHLAGYQEERGYLFDTHGQPVHPPVWDLYRKALRILGPVPTLIEWDTDIPSFGALVEEAGAAQAELDLVS